MQVKKFFYDNNVLVRELDTIPTYQEFLGAIRFERGVRMVFISDPTLGIFCILRVREDNYNYFAFNTKDEIFMNENSSVGYDFDLIFRFLSQNRPITEVEVVAAFERLENKSDCSGTFLSTLAISLLDLEGMKFENSVSRQLRVIKTNLQKANFYRAMLEGSTFNFSDISEAMFKCAFCTQAVFLNSKICNTCFCSTELSQVQFENCDLTGADFSLTWLKDAIFTNCILTGAKFKESILTGARFVRCENSEIVFENCADVNTVRFF